MQYLLTEEEYKALRPGMPEAEVRELFQALRDAITTGVPVKFGHDVLTSQYAPSLRDAIRSNALPAAAATREQAFGSVYVNFASLLSAIETIEAQVLEKSRKTHG